MYELLVCQINLYEVQNSSQYKGVIETTNGSKKWRTVVCWQKKKYNGGYYLNELDGAKRVNQLCDKLGIDRKNPEVDAMPNNERVIFKRTFNCFSQIVFD